MSSQGSKKPRSRSPSPRRRERRSGGDGKERAARTDAPFRVKITSAPPRARQKAGGAAGGQSSGSSRNFETWLTRVHSRQSSKMTPELRQRMREKSMRSQRASRMVRSVNKVRLLSKRSRKAWRDNCVTMSKSPAPEMKSVAAAATVQLQTIQTSLRTREDESAMMRFDTPSVALAEQAEEVDDDEVESLLNSLRVEPSNDAEREAKFVLYSNYLETVVAIRKEAFAFWAECKTDFEGRSRSGIEAKLRSIDGEEKLAINFDGPNWFVWNMTSKAMANQSYISSCLDHVRNKLEMMSAQDQCPICIESLKAPTPTISGLLDEAKIPQYAKALAGFTFEQLRDADAKAWDKIKAKAGIKSGHLMRLRRLVTEHAEVQPVPVHILQCCHKVCKPCWEHYRTFSTKCPLCRSDDFLGALDEQHSRVSPMA